MSKFKIYGVPYELAPEADGPIDSYGYGGELVDDEPKGKCVGYVTMEDGSVVACYRSINILLIILPLVVLVATAVFAVIFILPILHKDVTTGGTMLEIDVGKNVVTFNGIMEADSDELDVRFLNGDEHATITVEGDGVVTEEVQVEPNEFIEKIPVTVTSSDSVVEVKVRIKSNETINEFNALVEIPANGTPYDPNSGLNGYFSKELILDETIE